MNADSGIVGMTNGSDFSRYARGKKQYIIGTTTSAWVVGTLVSLVGLVSILDSNKDLQLCSMTPLTTSSLQANQLNLT